TTTLAKSTRSPHASLMAPSRQLSSRVSPPTPGNPRTSFLGGSPRAASTTRGTTEAERPVGCHCATCSLPERCREPSAPRAVRLRFRPRLGGRDELHPGRADDHRDTLRRPSGRLEHRG